MYIVFLRFSNNKAQAGQFMDGHNAWIKQGFDDGVFLLVGSLQPNQGGTILAYGCTQDELQERVNQDPFVCEDIVSAEVLEVSAAKADARLSFLLE